MHGKALGGMQAKQAAFNVTVFQAAQNIIELFMRGRGPGPAARTSATLQKSQLNPERLGFTQQPVAHALIFNGGALSRDNRRRRRERGFLWRLRLCLRLFLWLRLGVCFQRKRDGGDYAAELCRGLRLFLLLWLRLRFYGKSY